MDRAGARGGGQLYEAVSSLRNGLQQGVGGRHAVLYVVEGEGFAGRGEQRRGGGGEAPCEMCPGVSFCVHDIYIVIYCTYYIFIHSVSPGAHCVMIG